MRLGTVLLAIVLCVWAGSVWNAERGTELVMESELTHGGIEAQVEKEIELLEPLSIPVYTGKAHTVIGDAALWMACNLNRVDGWSLTGRAITTVEADENYRLALRRWKFGIVTGEMEAMRGLHDPYVSHLYDEDDRGMQYGVVLGFHFYREF